MSTLLIDGDVLLWRAASAVQESHAFGNMACISADFGRAKDKFDAEVQGLRSRLNAGQCIVALSDPRANWRKDVLPTYKNNRATAKPKVFYQLREHCQERYRSVWLSGLEGDDVLGLIATAPLGEPSFWTDGFRWSEPRIVVSVDKDMKQLPCRLYNPGHPRKGGRVTTLEQGDRFHMMQTLTGDPVDGYAGCPGVGPKRADAILRDADNILEPASQRILWWRYIVAAYKSKGLSEADALVQARVSRILRHGEYDQDSGRVRLWTPPKGA